MATVQLYKSHFRNRTTQGTGIHFSIRNRYSRPTPPPRQTDWTHALNKLFYVTPVLKDRQVRLIPEVTN